MLDQPTPNSLNQLVSAATVLTLVGVFAAPIAFAKITVNTIDPLAIVTDNGRHLIVTGPINALKGRKAYIRVTSPSVTPGPWPRAAPASPA